MFERETKRQISSFATQMGVEPAALLAVVEVESAGRTGVYIGSEFRPLIRIEGHYFYRRLSGEDRDRAVRLGLASPRAGAVKNPRSQTKRYQMLEDMKAIDEVAALESCSWGLGQVMGANWRALGYRSVHELVNEAMSGVVGQVSVMCRFIKANNLVDELRSRNWAGFARAYNGPAYRKNRYDEKMAEAYRRYSSKPHDAPDDGMLRIGDKGAEVREAQRLLAKHGYFLKIDGDFGPATRKIVRRFQAERGLEVDGIIGPKTMAALEMIEETAKHEEPGDKTEKAAKGLGFVGLSGAAAAELSAKALETSDRLGQFATFSDYILMGSTGLVVISLVLGVVAVLRRKKGKVQPA